MSKDNDSKRAGYTATTTVKNIATDLVYIGRPVMISGLEKMYNVGSVHVSGILEAVITSPELTGPTEYVLRISGDSYFVNGYHVVKVWFE